MFKNNLLYTSVIACIALTGCSSTHTEGYRKSHENSEYQVNEKFIEYKKKLEYEQDQIGEERQVFYVDKENFYLENKEIVHLPLDFKEEISYILDEEKSSNEFAAEIFKLTGIKIDFVEKPLNSNSGSQDANTNLDTSLQNNADSTGIIDFSNFSGMDNSGDIQEKNGFNIKPLSFQGDIKDFLDYIAIVNGLKWQYDEASEKVFFFTFSTETFYIYEKNLELTSDSSITANGAGGGNEGTQQSIQFSRTENAWDIIEDNINNFVSGEGNVSFNRRQGSVIVRDNDYVLSKIRKYVKDLNDEASKSVTIEIGVVNVTLTEGSNAGLDITYLNSALESSLLGDFQAGINSGTGSGIPTGLIDNVTEQSLQGILTDNRRFNGGLAQGVNTTMLSDKIFKANISNASGLGFLVGLLKNVGSVSVELQNSFQTLNNNPISVQITSNEDYVSEFVREVDALNPGRDNFSVEVDTVKDGISLNFTPKIIGEEVSVDYSLSLLNNDGFAPSPLPEVQLPKTSNKNFNQSVIMKNGQTTVLLTYENERDATESSSPFSDTLWFMGGQENYSQEKEIVVVTMTIYFDIK